MDANAPDPAGAEVFSFLFPVFVVAAIAMAVPLCAVLVAPAGAAADDLRATPERSPQAVTSTP